MLLKRKLPGAPTDGSWVAWLDVEARCCPADRTASDILQLSIHPAARGTLKSRLYDVFKGAYPKGVRTLFGATLYVVRINKQGERRMARPCTNCMSRLKTEGVKYVVFSTDEGWKRERL